MNTGKKWKREETGEARKLEGGGLELFPGVEAEAEIGELAAELKVN